MATVRQPLVNALVRNEKTGTEKAISCLGVTKTREGKLELDLAESVSEELPHPSEVLLISDRGTCWHRYRSDA